MAQDAGWGGGAYGGTPYGGPGVPPGPGGWGGGWMPPKPGVIPLGPLRLGDVLGGAFATVGRYGKQLFGVGAAAYGGALAVVMAAAAIAYSAVADHMDRILSLGSEESPRTEDWVPLVIAFGSVAVVGLIAVAVSTAMMYTAVPHGPPGGGPGPPGHLLRRLATGLVADAGRDRDGPADLADRDDPAAARLGRPSWPS